MFIRKNGREMAEDFLEKYYQESSEEENQDVKNAFKQFKKFPIFEKPLIFRTE